MPHVILSDTYLDRLKHEYGVTDALPVPEAYDTALERAERMTAHMFSLLESRLSGRMDEKIRAYLLGALSCGHDAVTDWNAVDDKGRDMVMAACDAVEPEIVKTLLALGVDRDRKTRVGGNATSALIIALSHTNEPDSSTCAEARQCVRHLLDARVVPEAARLDTGERSRAPLYFVRDAQAIKWLLDAGADPTEPDTDLNAGSAVHSAVLQNEPDKLAHLLNAGAPACLPDANGNDPLRIAIGQELEKQRDSGAGYLPSRKAHIKTYENAQRVRKILQEHIETGQNAFAAFQDNPDYDNLSVQDMMAIASTGHIKMLLMPESYEGQEDRASHLASELPIWLQLTLAPEISALYASCAHAAGHMMTWQSRVRHSPAAGNKTVR